MFGDSLPRAAPLLPPRRSPCFPPVRWVRRVFPSQTFAITMQIKTPIFIALAIAIGCASAENATYIGCYDDTTGGRDLPVFFCSNGKDGRECAVDPDVAHPYAGSAAMSATVCSVLCKGFKYFGLQFGRECFCGNDYGNNGGKMPENSCDQPCSGDPSTICGAANQNSIYAQPPSMVRSNMK